MASSYIEKKQEYFSFIRKDLFKFLPKSSNNKVLEVGAAGGNTLIAMKEAGFASEVAGIELNEIPDSNQRNPFIDRFIIGDIEKINLDFQQGYFDAIICADVLEHLFNPWAVVAKLKNYLKNGGVIIASLPNIMDYTVLADIIFKGDFKYTHSGILDKTHIRFFCRKNMEDLFISNGLKIKTVQTYLERLGPSSKRRFLNKLTFGLFEEFLTRKYTFVAEK